MLAARMATTHHGYWTAAEKRTWTLMLFLGALIVSVNLFCLPVTIVAMAEELQWDERHYSAVVSSFYWGYILFQVAGGWLADRHRSERVLWVAGVIWSLAGLSIACLAYVSTIAVVAGRFIAGIAQGVYYPAFVSLMSKKVDPSESSFYVGVANAGSAYGPILVGICAVFLSPRAWPAMHVTFGMLGLLWAFILRAVSRRFRDEVETNEVKTCLTSSTRIEDFPTSVPWKHILTNDTVIAIISTHYFDGFFIHNLFFWSPTYFLSTPPTHWESVWVSNSLPWLAIALAGPVGGWTVHRLAGTCGLGMSRARKVIMFVCLGTEALCFIAIATFSQSHRTLDFMGNFFLTVASFGHGVMIVGPTMMLTDIVPDHVGAVYGVMNTIGAIPLILGMLVPGYILHDTSDWPLVFATMTILNITALLGNLLIVVCRIVQLTATTLGVRVTV